MNSSQCSVFVELSHSIAFQFISAFKGIFCVVGAVCVSQLWRNGVSFLVHANTKMLFRFYLALNFLIAVIFGYIYLSELIRLRFECFLIDFRYVLLTRGLGHATVYSAQHVILVLSVERLYSAIFPAKFEKFTSKQFALLLAFVAIFGTYSFSIIKLSNYFRLFFDPDFVVVFLNPSVRENEVAYKELMKGVVISNCLSLFLLCVDLYLNFLRKPKTNASLAVSYQISENRRVVLTLLPIELTQTLVVLFTAVALTMYRKFNPDTSTVGSQIAHEMFSLTSFLPLIMCYIIKYSAKKRSRQVRPIDPDVDHFEALRKMWE